MLFRSELGQVLLDGRRELREIVLDVLLVALAAHLDQEAHLLQVRRELVDRLDDGARDLFFRDELLALLLVGPEVRPALELGDQREALVLRMVVKDPP